mgnify:CR=1 FL=1
MISTYPKIREEHERRVNRTCAVACAWVSAVLAVIIALGLTGALYIDRAWMAFYAVGILLPVASVGWYAKRRDYRGSGIRYLMVLAAALVPCCMAVPSIFGFFLMPLPIVVAGRYFSRRFVWQTYGLTILAMALVSIPHAYFGSPSYPLCEATEGVLRRFLDGQFDPLRYWSRYLMPCGFPSLAICTGFFAITVDRLCAGHLQIIDEEAKTHARLIDVEKGLAIAATMQVIEGKSKSEELRVKSEEGGARSEEGIEERRQPEVADWSMDAVADCIAKCKARIAVDPAFAELVERDPAAAVREVQA